MTVFDLDHVGIAVGDLDATATAYRRLGFTLSERSWHMALAVTDGAPMPRGTGKHCIMLTRGYVELIGITDPSYQGRLRQHLKRYQGLHITAFGCPDAGDAVARLGQRGFSIAEPRRLTRPIVEKGKPAVAEFSIIDLPDGAVETYAIAIEHHTRDVLWQPHLMSHANGARTLVGLTLCVADPADAAHRLAALLAAPCRRRRDGYTVELAFGTVDVIDGDVLARRYPGTVPPSLPFVAGVTVTVHDLAVTGHLLEQSSISIHAGRASSFWINPAATCGAVFEFVAS
ncbi:MAG: VOC family protein [Alphaproteobacteria bacterium]|nr:VOC family protein [Alphaproteobacteria bacterium]